MKSPGIKRAEVTNIELTLTVRGKLLEKHGCNSVFGNVELHLLVLCNILLLLFCTGGHSQSKALLEWCGDPVLLQVAAVKICKNKLSKS